MFCINKFKILEVESSFFNSFQAWAITKLIVTVEKFSTSFYTLLALFLSTPTLQAGDGVVNDNEPL
jgi:hypothetical protein